MESLLARLVEAMPVYGGLHDLLKPYRDAGLFNDLVVALSDPFRGDSVTCVLGSESRGFLLGGAVALHLGVGFVAARKPDRYLPGEVVECTTEPDWEGKQTRFQVQQGSLLSTDRVLLVDDWYTTGSHGVALRSLIEACGATYVGTSVLVEEMTLESRARLDKFHALLFYHEEVRLSGDGTFARSSSNLSAFGRDESPS